MEPWAVVLAELSQLPLTIAGVQEAPSITKKLIQSWSSTGAWGQRMDLSHGSAEKCWEEAWCSQSPWLQRILGS